MTLYVRRKNYKKGILRYKILYDNNGLFQHKAKENKGWNADNDIRIQAVEDMESCQGREDASMRVISSIIHKSIHEFMWTTLFLQNM